VTSSAIDAIEFFTVSSDFFGKFYQLPVEWQYPLEYSTSSAFTFVPLSIAKIIVGSIELFYQP